VRSCGAVGGSPLLADHPAPPRERPLPRTPIRGCAVCAVRRWGAHTAHARHAQFHARFPSASLKGSVKVPQKEQYGPTPHPPMLEPVFENDGRC
jgi:hypothetical protein